MADNRKLMAGILNLPESARQDLARQADEFERFKKADYLRKIGEQGAGLAKSVARGVPQMATGFVDLAAMPFEAAGMIEPGKAVGSTKWLEEKGYLPPPQEGFVNQTAEMLASGLDPSTWTAHGVPLLAGIGKTVWHGSPHTFDKFDLSKIGTGEGAQAYGHGLYLAESPAVAKEYADELGTKVLVNGKTLYAKNKITAATGNSDLDDYLSVAFGNTNSARKHIIEDMQDVASKNPEAAKTYQNLLDKLDSLQVYSENTGQLYKVDLPDEQIAKMLDYDLPLAQQPESVKQSLLQLNDPHINEALSTSPVYNEGGDYWSYIGNTYGSKNEALRDVTPSQLISGQRGGFKSPQEASQRFYETGIPGIQYLDQASRGAGDGTRNYVVFSDEIPQILERNNVPVNK